jgi:hypothetical protein
MWLANLVSISMIKFWQVNNSVTLSKIWWALAAFMGAQVITGVLRFQSKTGVWKVLRQSESQGVN